jgi:hypothetical protein
MMAALRLDEDTPRTGAAITQSGAGGGKKAAQLLGADEDEGDLLDLLDAAAT